MTRQVPLNLFAIPFGLSGLATAWAYAARLGLAPPANRDVLTVIAALVWTAGGLLAADAAGVIGQTRIAQALFGLGVVSWLILGSMILTRLLFWPPLPAPLMPTIAIEVAPASVASLAYFSIAGEHIDAIAAGLGGYGLLMVLAQIRLLPVYRRLAFSPGFWAFAFSWAAVATAGLHWLADLHPSGWRALSYVVLAAISLLVSAIAARTMLALARDQLLPPAPQASA